MRLFWAFIITLLIYVFLIWLYFLGFHKINHLKPKELPRVKISLISEPTKPTIKPKVTKSKVIKKIKRKKKKIKKKLNNRKIIKKTKKKHIKRKKVKKVKKRHITNKKVKKKLAKKPKILKNKSKEKKIDMVYIDTPLFKEKTSISPKKSSNHYPNRKIKRLYGKEFFSYTPKQKKFIEKNLDKIHEITQRVLWQRGYPGGMLSAKTGQEGENIVSFYLHPNGDISNLRLNKKIGYQLLDDNTLETIKTAYKDYPYPPETTKIVFFVEYSIFGY